MLKKLDVYKGIVEKYHDIVWRKGGDVIITREEVMKGVKPGGWGVEFMKATDEKTFTKACKTVVNKAHEIFRKIEKSNDCKEKTVCPKNDDWKTVKEHLFD